MLAHGIQIRQAVIGQDRHQLNFGNPSILSPLANMSPTAYIDKKGYLRYPRQNAVLQLLGGEGIDSTFCLVL